MQVMFPFEGTKSPFMGPSTIKTSAFAAPCSSRRSELNESANRSISESGLTTPFSGTLCAAVKKRKGRAAYLTATHLTSSAVTVFRPAALQDLTASFASATTTLLTASATSPETRTAPASLNILRTVALGSSVTIPSPPRFKRLNDK